MDSLVRRNVWFFSNMFSDIVEQLRDAMGVLNEKLDQTLKKLGTEEEGEFTGMFNCRSPYFTLHYNKM